MFLYQFNLKSLICSQENKSIFRKDVRLPVQLQRAMAAEAEAAREARAKVGMLIKVLNLQSGT